MGENESSSMNGAAGSYFVEAHILNLWISFCISSLELWEYPNFIPTFFDLAMEVDGIHRGSDDVGVAVPSCHDASDFIHQLHGHTCSKHMCLMF